MKGAILKKYLRLKKRWQTSDFNVWEEDTFEVAK